MQVATMRQGAVVPEDLEVLVQEVERGLVQELLLAEEVAAEAVQKVPKRADQPVMGEAVGPRTRLGALARAVPKVGQALRPHRVQEEGGPWQALERVVRASPSFQSPSRCVAFQALHFSKSPRRRAPTGPCCCE